MQRSWFGPDTMTFEATTINFLTDGTSGLQSNGVPVPAPMETSGSAIISLVPNTATITAMTCRGVTGPASTTPVPWKMIVTGKKVSIQIAGFLITGTGGTGTIIGINVGPTIPANLLPTGGATVAATRSVPMTNNNVNVATGIGELSVTAPPGVLTLSLDAGATLVPPVGTLGDYTYEWIITSA
jgi:hypothetical protein